MIPLQRVLGLSLVFAVYENSYLIITSAESLHDCPVIKKAG